MLPKISIIVPVYKVEKYLDRCIQSIVDQTYSNLEIILVDDGSPDRSGEICDRWSVRDSRIKVIHQENGGLSAARNKGIENSQGKYLYFVDSDDWIAPTLCEKVMDVFSEHKSDIVVFDCEQITEAGKSIGRTETLQEGMLSQNEALQKLLTGKINNYACNKVYKREVFQDVRFPARAFEDMAVSYRLFLKANSIYCINEPLYFYFQRTGSITSALNGEKLSGLFLSRWECYEKLRPIYPEIAELVFPKISLVARRLYDCSLWDQVDENVYNHALGWMRENKEKILKTENSFAYRLFYGFPWAYRMLRLGKHCMGNAVRSMRKIVKRS